MKLLLQELRSKLQYKIIIPFILLALCVVLVGSTIAFRMVAGSWQERFDNQLAQVTRVANDRLLAQELTNLQFLEQVIYTGPNQARNHPSVQQAVVDGNPDVLIRTLDELFQVGMQDLGLQIDRLIIFDQNGQSLADLERPPPDADTPYVTYTSQDFSEIWFASDILNAVEDPESDKYARLLQLNGTEDEPASYYLCTIAPIIVNGDIVGGAIAAVRLENLLTRVREQSQANVLTIYDSQGQALSSTLMPKDGLAALNMNPDVFKKVQEALDSDNAGFVTDQIDVDQRSYQFAYTPLRLRNETVGIFSAGQSRDYVTSSLSDARTPLIILTVLAMVMISGMGSYIAHLITAPLDELVRTARSVTAGNFQRRSRIRSQDEIGVLSQAFNSMTEHLLELYTAVLSESSQRAAIVESIPDGIVVCDEDGCIQVMNHALRRMLGMGNNDPLPARLADLPLVRMTEGMPDFDSRRAKDFYTLGGSIVHLSLSQVITPREDSMGFVCVVRDMTPEVIAEEISNFHKSFYNLLSKALHIRTIVEFSTYTRPNIPRDQPNLIPPGLDAAFDGFDRVVAIMQGYQEATSPVTKRDTLLAANEQLELTAQQILLLPEPFGPILELVVSRWRQVLTAEGGLLARAQMIGPIPNPYVTGNPVQGDLFIGRDDILHRLRELWSKEGQIPSVILYGHRRMGKSSILQNLGTHIDTGITVVDFNMQRVGLVENTGELLLNLAWEIYHTLPMEKQAVLEEPDENRFTPHNPYAAFNHFLKHVDRIRTDQRFVVTMDEFELIEELITRERLDLHFLDFLRGLIQTYPWFIIVFAGLHTLEEMRYDYWHPFFGSITSIPVSFLSPEATRQLITQPSPDFPIDYDAEAVEQIIALTYGQPYLVQLIGHALVTRFNQQTFEEGKEQARRFSSEDVAAVISTPEFYRDGNAYFSGVWKQAAQSQPEGQTRILTALCYELLSRHELGQATHLTPDQLDAALDVLQQHDVIIRHNNGRYGHTIELMRRWVLQYKDG